jgi:hypothetical protein
MIARLATLVLASAIVVVASIAGCASKTDHASPPPPCVGVDCAKGIGGGGSGGGGSADATSDSATDAATDAASDGSGETDGETLDDAGDGG